MITQQSTNRSIPKRSSLAIFAFIILCTAVAMSCTDMQTQNVFDEEDLNLMTDVDQTGERGYHEILIFLRSIDQVQEHGSSINQLRKLKPEYIQVIETLPGDEAVEKYGPRAKNGVAIVRTNLDSESYNTTLRALGMEPQMVPPPSPPTQMSDKEDYFIVVEKMPELKGGLEGIMENIRYPAEAKQKGIEGRVYVQFVVTEEGEVEDAKVIRGIGAGADDEALRVVREAKFEPGYQRGKPVRVQYSLPIYFQLADNWQETTSSSEAANQEEGLTVTSYASTEVAEPEVNYKTMEVDVSESGGIIEGKVIDAETGLPLIGANIIIQGSNEGTSTDQDGYFTIRDQEVGSSGFLVSYIGYQTTRYRP